MQDYLLLMYNDATDQAAAADRAPGSGILPFYTKVAALMAAVPLAPDSHFVKVAPQQAARINYPVLSAFVLKTCWRRSSF